MSSEVKPALAPRPAAREAAPASPRWEPQILSLSREQFDAIICARASTAAGPRPWPMLDRLRVRLRSVVLSDDSTSATNSTPPSLLLLPLMSRSVMDL